MKSSKAQLYVTTLLQAMRHGEARTLQPVQPRLPIHPVIHQWTRIGQQPPFTVSSPIQSQIAGTGIFCECRNIPVSLLSCQPPFLHPASPLLKLHSPSSFIPSFSPFIIPLHYFGISHTSEAGYYLSTKIEYLPYFQQVRSTPYIAWNLPFSRKRISVNRLAWNKADTTKKQIKN